MRNTAFLQHTGHTHTILTPVLNLRHHIIFPSLKKSIFSASFFKATLFPLKFKYLETLKGFLDI